MGSVSQAGSAFGKVRASAHRMPGHPNVLLILCDDTGYSDWRRLNRRNVGTPTRDDHLASCYPGPIGALAESGLESKSSRSRAVRLPLDKPKLSRQSPVSLTQNRDLRGRYGSRFENLVNVDPKLIVAH